MKNSTGVALKLNLVCKKCGPQGLLVIVKRVVVGLLVISLFYFLILSVASSFLEKTVAVSLGATFIFALTLYDVWKHNFAQIKCEVCKRSV